MKPRLAVEGPMGGNAALASGRVTVEILQRSWVKCCVLLLVASPSIAQPQFQFKTDELVYSVGVDGMNQAINRPDRHDNYLAKPSPFMRIQIAGKPIASSAIDRRGDTLRVRFGDTGVDAVVRVRELPEYLTFELLSIGGPPVSYLESASLPLTLTKYVSRMLASGRDDEYAVAVIPLNLETHSTSGSGVLTVEADARVRLLGAKFALVGCRTAELLGRIERIELENGLPHPTLGGVWARNSPEQRRSYLFVDLSEANANDMIEYARTGGFGYIVVYDAVWNASHGTYTANRQNFPSGDASLKAVSDKIHAAGLKFGMHNLDMVVDKTDPLVQPVPARGFMMYPEFRRTLSASIGPGDTFIPTTSSPAGLLAKTDKSRFQGRDLLIGDEIVTYDDFNSIPPLGFTGCKRGAHGTVAAAHASQVPIDNFSEFVGCYRPDVKSPLYDRVARAAAEAIDRYGFDYLYPDGTGENLYNWPDQPEWYAYNILISKLFGFTNRDVMWAHEPVTDYSWHIFSRGNTTDFVHAGIIEHFDKTSAATAKVSIANLQPFEFGWFGYFISGLDVRATRPREIEYAWSKALGWNAAMSLETDKHTLDANGRTREILGLIRNWEELKLRNYFPASILDRLKEPGKEFALERRADLWQVTPVSYSPERYVETQEEWSIDNSYADQPVVVTIEAMPVLAKYADPANVVLLAPERPLNLYTAGNGPAGSPARQTEGLSYELKPMLDGFQVKAVNRGATPAGWGCAEIILDGTKDLSQHRALGTWVEGDGSGSYLHFVIEDSGRWSVRDYYVRLDFKTRRYVQMPESAKGEIYDFAFPYSSYWAIRSLNFPSIARVYVFLTNVKPGQSVTARFGRLEALQESPVILKNPTLRVNAKDVTFSAGLETGWYLEWKGAGPAHLFDANGFLKAEIAPAGELPVLGHGPNRLALFGQGGTPAKVTVRTRGTELH